MENNRILFVDDEPGIFLTMPEILRQQGYQVTAAQTVTEALSYITSAQFDVLISDLNLGHPGDGFTVVGAMRRTQPTCVTFILTGYPGFDSALEAIRNQVDDYLIKPAPISKLLGLIESKLKDRKPGTFAATKRVSQVLRENAFEITQRALREMKFDPGLAAIPLTDEQRIDFIPRTIEDLAAVLESPAPEEVTAEAIYTARMRGVTRYQQGYSIPLLVSHRRIVEQAIFDVIHEHLLSLNLSHFMFELKRLNAVLSLQLEHTLVAFLNAQERGVRPAERER